MLFKMNRKAVLWRVTCIVIGLAFAVGTIVFVKPVEALGMCASDDRCTTWVHSQVHKFKHHRLGNSAHLTFPRKFKREYHQAMRQWRRHHSKGLDIPNPFAPIKTFVEQETEKIACGLSTAVVGGGNCDNVGTGGVTWPSVSRFRDNMTFITDVTIGCGGGSLIASFEKPANWRMLATKYGYRWNPWVLGTGTLGCTFATVYFHTRGH